jgi:Flp pilus assembly protein TadD
MLWAARGDLARALSDFDRALELNPHFADAYAQRGLARLRRGDEAGAARDFAQCLAPEPVHEPRLPRQYPNEISHDSSR